MSAAPIETEVIWHDVECGAYDADLPLWDEMARAASGPVLELGCGTGRVVLHLARRGHETVGLDSEGALLAALRERARGLPVTTVHADAREFELERPVALTIAPTHVLQLLHGRGQRLACLRSVAAALAPRGLFAASILEAMPPPEDVPPPPPDVREVDGWVYSSLAVDVLVEPEAITVRRLRQTVSPAGTLSEERNEVRIETFPAEQLEAELAEAGLTPVGRREIAATDLHVGSVVVIAEREG